METSSARNTDLDTDSESSELMRIIIMSRDHRVPVVKVENKVASNVGSVMEELEENQSASLA